ncbi:hypothetical protein JTB14_030319 [Gonioctena quinquepunctata]|nr:hypothetical protein JTB14_030319 [Gonioctena quinquepunctata]
MESNNRASESSKVYLQYSTNYSARDKMYQNVVLLIFAALIKCALCGNILIVDDIPTAAQEIFDLAIAEALAAKGHNVTLVIPNSIKYKENDNLHVILFEGLFEMTKEPHHYDIERLTDLGPVGNTMLQLLSSEPVCDVIINTQGFQTIMNYPKDFKLDAIIVTMTMETCLLPLIQKFNYPPAIASTSYGLPASLAEIFGGSQEPSYIPFHAMRFSEKMNFWERLQNYFWSRFQSFMRQYYVEGRVEAKARKVFGEGMDSFDYLRKHVSLVICNLIPGFHYARPISPNIIPAGGIHIKPINSLPKDLQEIMDNAKHGVILVSFGSNVRSDRLKPEQKRTLFGAFGRLKQTVVWKFESDDPDLPKNVVNRKFLPQTAILAHPNLKLFIGHGGGMSTTEAVFFGVPILGMPFIGDQLSNVDLLVDRGMGRKLDFKTITEDSLLENIEEMLNNPTYIQTAKKISSIVKDKPQSPADLATFWVEFVIRHNGTHLLEPKARELSLFISSSTDVFLFLAFVISTSIFVTFRIVSCIWRRLFKQKQKKVKKN